MVKRISYRTFIGVHSTCVCVGSCVATEILYLVYKLREGGGSSSSIGQ